MNMVDENTECVENEDLFEQFRTKEFKIDEKYEYVHKGRIFRVCSNILYYCIAYPILKIITKILYDLKIEGKENIRNLKGGAISVSNHVLVLDCAMIGLACGRKKVYYTTLESHFKIPFIRRLIKLLRAIPIPTEIKNKEHFINSIEELLKNNNVIHFYPEASLVPYCNTIRKFRSGAFNIAVKNQVPIVPMVFQFRNPKGLRKIFKRKKDVTLKILEPIICEENMDANLKIENLKETVYQDMKSKV